MSNEELAARIKDGKREYIEILWNQNQGIIRKIAGRYLWRAQIMRYDFEDLTQECYFALVPSPENLGEDTTERMAMKELAQKYGTTPSRLKKRIDAALVRIQGKARLKGIIHPRRIYRYRGGTSWNSTTESSALDNIQAEEGELRRILWGERNSHP